MGRVWAGLLIACWVGTASAQWASTGTVPTPPAARPAAQPAGEILIQRTAGQPERRLRLLKMGAGPDGDRYADLEDVASGAKYSVPAIALAGMKRASADAGPPTTGTTRVSAGGKFPTSLTLPEPAPGSHSPFAARPPAPPPEVRPQPTPRWGNHPPPAESPAADPPVPAVSPAPVPEPPTTQQTSLAAPVAVAPLTLEPWQRTRAEQMRAEVEPYAHDLVHALRPSVRERAATALANGRHASHPEVKQLLARTAMTDPAPTVQAHCVRALAALGYHAADYREFLEAAAGAGHAGLRQAAGAALGKLAPR